MRIYFVKHKGANTWQNINLDREIVFSDLTKIYAGLMFFRKKDAKKYLASKSYSEFYEVVGATVDISKKDNRKSKYKK